MAGLNYGVGSITSNSHPESKNTSKLQRQTNCGQIRDLVDPNTIPSAFIVMYPLCYE